MQLSKRLQAVADSVTKGNRVADVGCDHAYISIYLIQHNIAPHVIAMDINKGPLKRGRENIERLGFSSQIETRLSDGLHQLNPGEADTILIAGMGGALTVQILEEGLTSVKKCKELVLQPQSELFLVRKFIEQIEFEIIAEQMLIDDGKYYTIIKAIPKVLPKLPPLKVPSLKVPPLKVPSPKVPGTSISVPGTELTVPDTKTEDNGDKVPNTKLIKVPGTELSELYYRYGKLLLQQRNPIAKEYLLKEKNLRLQVIKELKQNLTENAIIRLKEVQEELGYIEEGLEYYK